MTDRAAREDVVAQVDREREAWRSLVQEVGPDRMEEPGPMGDWSFKDLAAHLLAWRERTIARLEAAGGGPPATEAFWPAHVADDDDSVNAWIHEQDRDRPAADVLRDVDQSYARMRAAIERLDEDVVVTPGRLPWLDGASLAQASHSSHFMNDHEPSVREWLASRNR
jgi:uncharacterized protein (TIGR03083 family)